MPRSPHKRVRALAPAAKAKAAVKVEDEAPRAAQQGLKRPRPRCEACLVRSAGEACVRTRCIECCKAAQSEKKTAAGTKKTKGDRTNGANVECKFHAKIDPLLLGWVEGYQERATLRSDPARLPRGQHVDKLFEHEGDTACLFSIQDLLASTAYKRWKPATISQSRMSKWHIETQFRRHDTETRTERFKHVLKRLQTKHGISDDKDGDDDVASVIAAANAGNLPPVANGSSSTSSAVASSSSS